MLEKIEYTSQDAEKAREAYRDRLSQMTPDEFVFKLFSRSKKRPILEIRSRDIHKAE